jgi:hypothetical protein
MKKYLHCLFMALAAMLLALALPGCDQSGDDGADPPPSSGVYESVEDLAGLAGLETGGPYTVILGSSIDISQSWGAINDAIYAAKKYVVLDLAACSAEDDTIAGNLSSTGTTDPSGNDFNVIRYNPYITGLVLPKSLKYIDNAAFMDCFGLGSVILPEGLLTIGHYAFYNCGSLTALTLPDSLTTIGGSAFQNSGLTAISIPDGIVGISGSTFSGCKSLASVRLPSGLVHAIATSTFRDCTSLTAITIPTGVPSIAATAFPGCTNLTTVVFEGGSTTIANNNSFPNGTTLKTAYEGGGAGTYTKNGTTWSKSL